MRESITEEGRFSPVDWLPPLHPTNSGRWVSEILTAACWSVITGESWNCRVENWTKSQEDVWASSPTGSSWWWVIMLISETRQPAPRGVQASSSIRRSAPGPRLPALTGRILFPLSHIPSPLLSLLIKIWVVQKNCTVAKPTAMENTSFSPPHAYLWRVYYRCGTDHHPWGLAVGVPNTQSNSISKTASLCIAPHGTEKNHVGALFSFVARYV